MILQCSMTWSLSCPEADFAVMRKNPPMKKSQEIVIAYREARQTSQNHPPGRGCRLRPTAQATACTRTETPNQVSPVLGEFHWKHCFPLQDNGNLSCLTHGSPHAPQTHYEPSFGDRLSFYGHMTSVVGQGCQARRDRTQGE